LDEIRPPEMILVPVGEYDGVDLPSTWTDENYIVWVEVDNPELNCEVIFNGN
jgi:hypothetical protein